MKNFRVASDPLQDLANLNRSICIFPVFVHQLGANLLLCLNKCRRIQEKEPTSCSSCSHYTSQKQQYLRKWLQHHFQNCRTCCLFNYYQPSSSQGWNLQPVFVLARLYQYFFLILPITFPFLPCFVPHLTQILAALRNHLPS